MFNSTIVGRCPAMPTSGPGPVPDIPTDTRYVRVMNRPQGKFAPSLLLSQQQHSSNGSRFLLSPARSSLHLIRLTDRSRAGAPLRVRDRTRIFLLKEAVCRAAYAAIQSAATKTSI